MKDLDQLTKLKDYVLGNIEESAELAAMEDRLLTDKDYFEQLAIAEEELAQDYADGRLAGADREKFERRFLINEENRRRVKFAAALRQYIDKQPAADVLPTTDALPANDPLNAPVKPGFLASLLSVFTQPAPAFAALAVIAAAVVGILYWNNAANNDSEVLIALNKAYKQERPLESRISGLDYAPPKNITRGADDDSKINKIELDNAQLIAGRAVSANPESAAALHELGRVYLAQKKFDDAIKQLEKAVRLNPGDAKLRNDLGVAWLEKSRTNPEISPSMCDLSDCSKALAEFEAAIRLDQSYTVAYFNRAFTLQLSQLANQSKLAWEEYLKLDFSSKWAEEARTNLARLSELKPVSKNRDELREDFLLASDASDHSKARLIFTKNREIMSYKLIPAQLTRLYVQAKISGDEIAAARYLRGIDIIAESEKSNDPFWSHVVNFYKNASLEALRKIKLAHDLNYDGFSQCRDSEYAKAAQSFSKASALFLEHGNAWESNIANIFHAYAIFYSAEFGSDAEVAASLKNLQVEQYARGNEYKWLLALALTRIASVQANRAEFTHSIDNYREAYLISKELGDTYGEQKNLTALAALNSDIGLKKNSLGYISLAFDSILNEETSLRQRSRTYFDASRIFASIKEFEMAKNIASEAVALGHQIEDPSFLSLAETQAGIIYGEIGELDYARSVFNDAVLNAKKIPTEKASRNLLSYAYLNLGELETKARNFQRAGEIYEDSLNKNNAPYFKLEAQKGQMRALYEANRSDELAKLVPVAIETAESNREKILEEQQSNNYFNIEHSVYEIPVEWEYSRGNFEAAYDYMERSTARALLSRMSKANPNRQALDAAGSNRKENEPLNLSEIRQRMPEEAQIVQYFVLEKQILVACISREKFNVFSIKVTETELQESVAEFLALQNTASTENSQELGRLAGELYRLLISPIREYLDNSKQICIVPGKILFHLPFAALQNENGKPLISDLTLSYAPSASVFIYCTENANRKTSHMAETLLAIGNPSFDRSATDLPLLAEAEGEVKTIAGLYDKSLVFTAGSATKQNVAANMLSAEVLHFAAHYQVKPGAPLQSSLLLAKNGQQPEAGLLTNEEILNSTLAKSKLVVLSACDSGVETYLNGEGMIGLSRAFLAAQAPLVVASQWKIEDSAATAKLMQNMHRYRRLEKLSTAAALRKAQLEILNAPDGKTRSPYYWAAFAAYGGFTKY